MAPSQPRRGIEMLRILRKERELKLATEASNDTPTKAEVKTRMVDEFKQFVVEEVAKVPSGLSEERVQAILKAELAAAAPPPTNGDIRTRLIDEFKIFVVEEVAKVPTLSGERIRAIVRAELTAISAPLTEQEVRRVVIEEVGNMVIPQFESLPVPPSAESLKEIVKREVDNLLTAKFDVRPVPPTEDALTMMVKREVSSIVVDKLNAMPKTLTIKEIQRAMKTEVDAIPAPITLDVIQRTMRAEIATITSPHTMEEMKQMIVTEVGTIVTNELSILPSPSPLDTIRQMFKMEMEKIVTDNIKELPSPPTIENIRQEVSTIVADKFNTVPPPITSLEIQRMLDNLPVPTSAEDLTTRIKTEVGATIADKLKALPTPASTAELHDIIKQAVEATVTAELGKLSLPTLDAIQQMVKTEISIGVKDELSKQATPPTAESITASMATELSKQPQPLSKGDISNAIVTAGQNLSRDLVNGMESVKEEVARVARTVNKTSKHASNWVERTNGQLTVMQTDISNVAKVADLTSGLENIARSTEIEALGSSLKEVVKTTDIEDLARTSEITIINDYLKDVAKSSNITALDNTLKKVVKITDLHDIVKSSELSTFSASLKDSLNDVAKVSHINGLDTSIKHSLNEVAKVSHINGLYTTLNEMVKTTQLDSSLSEFAKKSDIQTEFNTNLKDIAKSTDFDKLESKLSSAAVTKYELGKEFEKITEAQKKFISQTEGVFQAKNELLDKKRELNQQAGAAVWNTFKDELTKDNRKIKQAIEHVHSRVDETATSTNIQVNVIAKAVPIIDQIHLQGDTVSDSYLIYHDELKKVADSSLQTIKRVETTLNHAEKGIYAEISQHSTELNESVNSRIDGVLNGVVEMIEIRKPRSVDAETSPDPMMVDQGPSIVISDGEEEVERPEGDSDGGQPESRGGVEVHTPEQPAADRQTGGDDSINDDDVVGPELPSNNGTSRQKRAASPAAEDQHSKRPRHEERVLRWEEISIGPKRKSTKVAVAKQLNESGLPVTIINAIKQADVTRGTLTHRTINAKLNGGSPQICWNAQFDKEREWLKLQESLPNMGAAANEETMSWWKEAWEDKAERCPFCKWKDEKGEAATCLYFLNDTTVRVLIDSEVDDEAEEMLRC